MDLMVYDSGELERLKANRKQFIDSRKVAEGEWFGWYCLGLSDIRQASREIIRADIENAISLGDTFASRVEAVVALLGGKG